MRRIFLGTLVCAIIAIVLIGVIVNHKNHDQENSSPDKLTVIFPNLHFERSWNISDGASLWSIFILNNIGETVVRVGNNSDVKTALADGWSFSKDKKTLNLSLSGKYIFHDGAPITPEDTLLSLKRAISSPKMKHSDIYKSLLSADINESMTLNGNTIEIKLKNPLNALIYKLSIPEMSVAPKDYPDNPSKENLSNLSGPYQVTNFTSQKMSLKRHSSHPLLRDDSPDKVNIVEIGDTQEAMDYYSKADDIVLVGSHYAKSIKYLDLDGQKYLSAFALTEFFLPNVNSDKMNTDDKRKHIFSLIKKAFKNTKINEEIAERTDQIFTKNNISRIQESKIEKLYDSQPTKEKLEINLLLLSIMGESPIPFMIKEKLKDFGVNLNIIFSDAKSDSLLLQKKEYDLLYIYSGVSALDPIVEMIYLFNHPLFNFFADNKELNELLNKSKNEIDRSKYISLLKEVHFGLLKNYMILPLMHTRMVYCAKGKYKLKEMNYFDGSFNLWDWHKE